MYSRSLLQCTIGLLVTGSTVAAVPSPQAPPTYPTGNSTGNSTGSEPSSVAAERAAAVKAVFETAWDGYFTYAFPNDELLPITNGNANTFGGWGASAVDALSTAVIMQNTTIIGEILTHVQTIDWSQSYEGEIISLFETNIRYLGGMLAGYDLLKGPFSNLSVDAGQVDDLLTQSINLANNLSFAFDTVTGIPENNLYVGNQTTDGSTTNGLATIGTLVLEWTRLSDLTGNTTYGELAQKGESYLLNPQPASSQPFPGLVGTNVNISNGNFLDAAGGWVGGDDSFYEYLIKMYVYDQSRFAEYRDRWELAADSSITYLQSHPQPRPDLTFLAQFNGTELVLTSEHLACFDGGNFILGGLVLGNQTLVDFGLALVDGCEDTYNQTLTGIGPEEFSWDPSAVPANQTAFFEKAGFYITNGNYILRPEVMESFYYAYRATGSSIYQDYAWNAFQSISKYTRVGSGYSELVDVNADPPGFMPNGTGFQDSFFFAEVLKYAYIIHIEDDEAWQVQADGQNQFVFNTEAHPLKVAQVASGPSTAR